MHRGKMAAALVVVAGLALSGCEVVGTVDMDADGIDVDLRTIGTSHTCHASSMEPLAAEMTRTDDGRFVCHIVGRARWDDMSGDFGAPWVRHLRVRSGDEVFLAVPGWVTRLNDIDHIDLRVTTPGPIIAAHPGTAPWGNTAHITDAAGLAESGISIVGSMRPGLSGQATAMLVGVLAGLGVGTATMLRRRR